MGTFSQLARKRKTFSCLSGRLPYAHYPQKNVHSGRTANVKNPSDPSPRTREVRQPKKMKRDFTISRFLFEKSRRDNTLLTVGFNLRERSTHHQVPQGRHFAHQVSSLRDWAESLRAGVAALLCCAQKAESLSHTSVGQGTESRSPTYGAHRKIKAVSLAHESMRGFYPQGFQPCQWFTPFRRALPYASMRKAFSLWGGAQRRRYNGMRAESPAANGVRTFQSASMTLTGGLESPPSVRAESPICKNGLRPMLLTPPFQG